MTKCLICGEELDATQLNERGVCEACAEQAAADFEAQFIKFVEEQMEVSDD